MERRALARGDSRNFDREAALTGLNNFVADYHNEMVLRPEEAKKVAMTKKKSGLVKGNTEMTKKGGKKGKGKGKGKKVRTSLYALHEGVPTLLR